MMQQGEPVADVLYYYGDQVPNYVRLKGDDPAGVLPGYDYDVTDTEALLHRMVVDASGLHTPEGIHYRMLVLPPWRVIPLSVLEFVERYLQAGGTVVGERPLRPQGIVPAAEEARYRQLSEKIWGGCSAASPNTGVRVGRGTLFARPRRAALSPPCMSFLTLNRSLRLSITFIAARRRRTSISSATASRKQ